MRLEPTSPTAARITSTGALRRPVQSSKLVAPWRTSASRPSTTSQPGGARRGDERGLGAVGPVGEIDDGLPGCRLDEQLVAHRRRVHDQVAAGRVRRPVAAAA